MSNDEKSALELKREELEKVAATTNAARSGKGTRVKVGSTRGKNPQAISFENFDLSKKETLPTTISEFMDIFKDKPESTEPEMLSYLLDGYNDSQYTQASDPIAEYVEASWDAEVSKQFRLVVRNYSNATGVSIEDAVALIKPGIVASQSAPKS